MFIAYLVQEGEGCDYTIGCGVTLIELEAKTYDDALVELREEHIDGYLYYEDEQKLESVTLYEVAQRYEMPLSEWYAEKHRQDELEEQMKRREKELAEYNRLRKIYG